MWFFFGFITLTIFVISFGYKRLNARWKGVPGKIGIVEYEYKIERGDKGITGFKIGIEAYGDYDFALKRESKFDFWCKKLGLVVEHQVGTDEFDKEIYIISDDPKFCQALSSNVKMLNDVLKLFRSGTADFCRLKEMRYNNEKLWLSYKVEPGFNEKSITKLAATVAPRLLLVAAALIKAGQEVEKQRRDPFVIKAAIILAVSTGLAINGGLHLLRLRGNGPPITLDISTMVWHSVLLGLMIVTFLVAAIFYMLGRSSRTHLVLIEVVLIGTFGAIATCFVELRDMNIDFDRSIPAIHSVTTINKYVSTGRRRPNTYYLYVEDWNWTKQQETIKLNVNYSVYKRISIGDRVRIIERPGFLGYRWIEQIDKGW